MELSAGEEAEYEELIEELVDALREALHALRPDADAAQRAAASARAKKVLGGLDKR